MRLILANTCAVAALVLAASACSNTTSSLPPLPGAAPAASSESDAANASRVPNGYAIVRFRIAVPGRTHSAAPHRILPAYVSSATRKVAVTVQGANQSAATTQKFRCTAVCSGKIVAPLGVDVVTVQLEDKKSRVLSRGSATVVVFKTSGNVFDFTLDGVPASVALVPESNALPVVPASTGYVDFEARDADGRIVTPDGHYVDANGNPLVFAFKSSNAALRLSAKTVSAPGAPISFAYNGTQHVGTITLTPKASRGIHTTVTFHPATLRLVPGIAARMAPPLPISVLSVTQVPFSASAGFDPNAEFVLGNSGGLATSLAFNVATGEYGISHATSTGAPFGSPPIDRGAGVGFIGYMPYGNNLWSYELMGPSIATQSSSGAADPCAFNEQPIGADASGTLLCQASNFPGYVWDNTHSAIVAYGQDRKIEGIDGIDYFVTANDVGGTSGAINVYASGSTTPVANATTVGANVTSTTTAYYGNADGTVTIVGGSTAATFSHEIVAVIGSGATIYAYENGGIFGVSNASGTFESTTLPIGSVVDVITGVNGAPMLVEGDGTLDVMGI